MSKTLTAVFDGKVLVPDDPAELEPNRRYQLVESRDLGEEEGLSAWDVLNQMSGSVDMPEDWSLEHDHYIHGTPKRCGGTEPNA